jgi:hypothetical protein
MARQERPHERAAPLADLAGARQAVIDRGGEHLEAVGGVDGRAQERQIADAMHGEAHRDGLILRGVRPVSRPGDAIAPDRAIETGRRTARQWAHHDLEAVAHDLDTIRADAAQHIEQPTAARRGHDRARGIDAC